MRHLFGRLALAVLLTIIVGVPARADAPHDICFGGVEQAKDGAAYIAACTAIIDMGTAEPEELATALGNRGEAYMAAGRYQDAMQDCQAVLRIAPRQVMTEKLCGDAYLATNDADAAISHYTRALRATSVFLRGLWGGRARAYMAAERYDEALADADHLVRYAGSESDSYLLRGEVYLALKDYPHALEDFQQALRLDPDSEAAQDGRDNAKAAIAARH